jgi:transcriptional regulator with XRE-family HTH domain
MTTFGTLLREWRTARRLTQEQLAFDAEVSTRHLSCLENGRALPSREMVLVLGSALDVPLRERNTLLVSAGFTAVYRETNLDAPEMASVRQAVDFILARQEPYGALLVDAAWNVHRANDGARRLLAALSDVPSEVSSNLLRLTLDARGLRRFCANWEQVACAAVERAHREAAAEGPNGPVARILAEVLALPEVPQGFRRPTLATPLPVIVPIQLKLGSIELSLFSTITTLGTPADIAAQELRIESWFPADEASDRLLHSLAEG